MQATEKQISYIKDLLGTEDPGYLRALLRAYGVEKLEGLSKEDASKLIEDLKKGREAVKKQPQKGDLETAKKCMAKGISVASMLGENVSPDKKAEIAGRWGITFYLEARRGRQGKHER
jgi:hypothetical protein